MRGPGDGMFRVDNPGSPKSLEAQREQGLLPKHDPSSTFILSLGLFSLGLFIFMKLLRPRIGPWINQSVLFLH